MERLQKVMAHDGVASRRKSEKIILAGRVKVNGHVVTKLGTKVKSRDEIEVDNVPITKERQVYYLFYKPRKVISSVDDEKDRTTVVDYFPDVQQRIYPVGRLDYDTAGLIILTNDGELDNCLTHPKYEVPKTYVAKVKGIPNNSEMEHLRWGTQVAGRKVVPDHIKVLASASKTKNAVIAITVHEGRNHEIKQLFSYINHPVKKLTRIQYSFLTIGRLKPGQYRFLRKEEVNKLKSLAGKPRRA